MASVAERGLQWFNWIAKTPALQVLHDTAAQQTIGSHAVSPGAGRKRAACRQTLADQVDQNGIVQEGIDGIEQIVLEQGGLSVRASETPSARTLSLSETAL